MAFTVAASVAPARASRPKPPKKLQIGHAEYAILQGGDVQEAMEDRGTEGVSNGNVLKILLRNDRPFVSEAETLLHEVLHQCLYVAGLDLKNEDEEPVVRALSMHLFGVLRANPKFVSYLTHKE